MSSRHFLLEKLNKRGLHPVAALPSRMKSIPKRRGLLVNRTAAATAATSASTSAHSALRKGGVFHLETLHQLKPGPKSVENTRRGFSNAKEVTIAHAPSIYYWLYHRCGICFAEAQRLVEDKRLIIDGVTVEHVDDLEYQFPWSSLASMDISVRMETAQEGNSNGTQQGSNAVVPALKRALHRTYAVVCVHSRVMSTRGEESDPKSFLHHFSRVPPPQTTSGACSVPLQGEASKLGLNILRPAGFVAGMVHGLVLATNDVSVIRHWNSEFLGNFGVYDVRFPPGAPKELYDTALAELTEVMITRPARERSSTLVDEEEALHVSSSSSSSSSSLRIESLVPQPKTEVLLQSLPEALGGKVDVTALLHPKSDGARSSGAVDTTQRILISTSLLPFRALKRLKSQGAIVTCIKMGPFALPPSLARNAAIHAHRYRSASSVDVTELSPPYRRMTLEEMVAAFQFEKRMKTNKMLCTLCGFE